MIFNIIAAASLAILIQIIILYYMLDKPKVDLKYVTIFFIFGIFSVGFTLFLSKIIHIPTYNIRNYEYLLMVKCYFNVGIVEELSKLLAFSLVYVKFINKKINYKSLIFYFALVGMGFAYIENITYMLNGPAFQILAYRFFTATMLHMFVAMICGHGFSKLYKINYNGKNKIIQFITYFILTTLLHGTYNFLLMDRSSVIY